MQPHPYHQAIIDAYRLAGRRQYHQMSPGDARETLRAAIAAAPLPPDLPALRSVANLACAGPHDPIPLRVYLPLSEPLGTCVFFHGGGWVIGDLDQSDNSCRRLAGRAQCRVVSADYRLAPEHPYPAPLDDCWAALLWAAEAFPGPLLVAGESAGGNLAAAVAIRARDRGGPVLAGQMLAYPATDHDLATPSYQQFGPRNWLLSTLDMQWFWDAYCPPGVDRRQPEISPLRLDDTRGLAPAMIVIGELDPLRDEGLAYARRLAEGGVSVTIRCDARMVHGYLAAAGAVPAAAEALGDITRWMRARCAAN